MRLTTPRHPRLFFLTIPPPPRSPHFPHPPLFRPPPPPHRRRRLQPRRPKEHHHRHHPADHVVGDRGCRRRDGHRDLVGEPRPDPGRRRLGVQRDAERRRGHRRHSNRRCLPRRQRDTPHALQPRP